VTSIAAPGRARTAAAHEAFGAADYRPIATFVTNRAAMEHPSKAARPKRSSHVKLLWACLALLVLLVALGFLGVGAGGPAGSQLNQLNRSQAPTAVSP
jgi:hypothetical protein